MTDDHDHPPHPFGDPPGPGWWSDCYSHYCWEKVAERPFLICGECFHVFNTAEELVEDDRKARQEFMVPDVAKPRDPDQIFCCPHCVHDF